MAPIDVEQIRNRLRIANNPARREQLRHAYGIKAVDQLFPALERELLYTDLPALLDQVEQALTLTSDDVMAEETSHHVVGHWAGPNGGRGQCQCGWVATRPGTTFDQLAEHNVHRQEQLHSLIQGQDVLPFTETEPASTQDCGGRVWRVMSRDEHGNESLILLTHSQRVAEETAETIITVAPETRLCEVVVDQVELVDDVPAVHTMWTANVGPTTITVDVQSYVKVASEDDTVVTVYREEDEYWVEGTSKKMVQFMARALLT